MNRNPAWPAVAALVFLSGCSIDPRVYADTTPVFRIEEYFLGETRGWGMVQGRTGEVKRRFVVDMHGEWQGDTFVLKEDFRYDDGETDYREWRIKVLDAHRYSGTAADVNGEARGEARGNALNWHYSLDLDIDGRTWSFSFNDWMYLQEDEVLLNHAEFSKFGIRLGEVTIAFGKRATDEGTWQLGGTQRDR